MCWTAPVSLALGTAGVVTAAYSHQKGESKYFTIPLLYFSLMEFLQFFSYFIVDQCTFSANTTLTFLSLAHMAFQPIFVNMFLLSDMPVLPSVQFRRSIYAACLVCTALIFVKLIPLAPASLCTFGTLCGKMWCTVSGFWHLGWSIPQYTWPLPVDSFVFYSIAAFGLPLLYGAWKNVLLMVVWGPILAYFLTGGNWNEWPAVWCLYSVALILGVMTIRFVSKKS